MSADCYKFFPRSGNVWAQSKMFPPEPTITRKEPSGASLASLSGKRNFSKPKTITMTECAKECLEVIKRGNLNRRAVHTHMKGRTYSAIDTGISVLIRLGKIKSKRVGNGAVYQVVKEEVHS